MDNLKLKEEVQSLKTLSTHLESQLKLVGLELCDFPDDVLTLLDKCARIQGDSNMQDINLDCLREFYFIKKREWIDNKVIIASQTAELKKVTSVIEETNKEIAKLEIFLANVNKRLIADGALQRKIIEIEDKTKALLDRQKTVSEPKECNTEAIIEKIEELQSANQSR